MYTKETKFKEQNLITHNLNHLKLDTFPKKIHYKISIFKKCCETLISTCGMELDPYLSPCIKLTPNGSNA